MNPKGVLSDFSADLWNGKLLLLYLFENFQFLEWACVPLRITECCFQVISLFLKANFLVWWKKDNICKTQPLSPCATLSLTWVQGQLNDKWAVSDWLTPTCQAPLISHLLCYGYSKVWAGSEVNLQEGKSCVLSCFGSRFLFLSRSWVCNNSLQTLIHQKEWIIRI